MLFRSEEYFSIKGKNPGSGGSVSLALSQLADVSLSSPGNGESLVYSSSLGKWVNGAAGLSKVTVKLGNVSYDSVDGTVYLPAYPTSLPASDVYPWAKQSSKPSYIWDEIGNKPSWIGSTKPSYAWDEIGAKPTTFTPSAHSHSWSDIVSGKPTTLAGYGIADAFSIVPVGSGNNISLSGFQGGYWGEIGSYASFVQYNYGGQLRFDITGVSQRFIDGGGEYYSWRKLLDDSNYNNYSPTLTGGGASGTWGINITGTIDGWPSSRMFRSTDRAIVGNIDLNTYTFSGIIESRGSETIQANRPFWGYYPILNFWTGDNIAKIQIAGTDGNLYYRSDHSAQATITTNWVRLIDSDNYYSVISNVASATQLANTKYIFGQPFNGTGDVTGDMSNISRITMSNHLRIGGSYDLSSPWDAGLIAGKDSHNKVVATYLASDTNCATVGAHLPALNGWAELNLAGTQLRFSIEQTTAMRLVNNEGLHLHQGWYRTYGATGWYNSTYGGGIYMEDTTWVRIIGGRGFYVENTIQTTDEVDANRFKITSADGAGAGISLFGGASAFTPLYGLMFATTANFGTHGYVTGDWATYFTMNNTANRGWIYRNVADGINVFSISNGGSVWANGELYAAVGLYTDGYLSSKGQNTSDGRLKTDIHKFNGTEIIKSLSPKSFRWNDTAKSLAAVFNTDEIQYGLIAQETKKVAPWLVVDDMFHDGYMGVRYEKLIPVMLACQIEHLSRTEILEQKVAQLEKENNELKRRLYA